MPVKLPHLARERLGEEIKMKTMYIGFISQGPRDDHRDDFAEFPRATFGEAWIDAVQIPECDPIVLRGVTLVEADEKGGWKIKK